MAKIKQKFGRMDHISGYSRGAAAARYQPADRNTTSRIYGSSFNMMFCIESNPLLRVIGSTIVPVVKACNQRFWFASIVF